MNEKEFLNNMYESIVQSLTDGIHAADLNGRMRIYNDAQGVIEGYKREQVLGKKIETVYKLDKKTSLLYKVQREKKPINNVRQIYHTQHGHSMDVVTSVFPLIHDNKIIGSAAILKDYSKIYDLIERNIEIEKRNSENQKQKNNPKANNNTAMNLHYQFSDIITEDKKLLEDIGWAKLAAKNDSNVLIYGETGTGKELFAQSVHSYSRRKNNTFLAINCAAIPETLLESMLFGTTKGAFTGAEDKAGLFEKSEGGTLFLDEINSMPLMLQAKLLRVLEEKKVMRLGDSKYIPVNVRIVAGCNQRPRDAIENKTLRDDLFFRLSVMYISIPPLRDRKNDIDLLCERFINMYNEEFNKNIVGINEEVRNIFYEYEWPGNVRELKHIIEGAMNVVKEYCQYIQLSDIPIHIRNNMNIDNQPNFDEKSNSVKNNLNSDSKLKDNNIFQKIEDDEYDRIVECLVEANGNMAEAARMMGISRQQMHYRVKKYNIK